MNRLPAEFEKQRATVMLFPSRNDVWRHDCKPIRESMVALANILSEHEPVIMGVLPELMQIARTEYSFKEGVRLVEMKYNDCWARDTVSSVVYGDAPYISSFSFNAYGGELYADWSDDQMLDYAVSKEFGYPVRECPLTLEGGNMLPDGNGTLFLVKDSILNDNRNPGMSQAEAERLFKEATGARQIVWLERGLEGDETGGHIDNVMAFCDPHTILLSYTDDKENPHYEITHEIDAFLRTVRDADGAPYAIVHVPVPPYYYRTKDDSDTVVDESGSFPRKEGDVVLETYINFALANGVVVVPQYGGPLDAAALEVIGKAFPDRKIVPHYGREASLGGGGFHCLTKHIH
ncbi:MAG: agmatine deiminase family protein [Clostridia bacterium]|nr:agmatine deiminase family protein [Clostridia bacterium]